MKVMDPRLLRYYRKKISGGKSMIARTVDFMMLRIIIFIVLFIAVLNMSLSIFVSLIMAFFLTAALSTVFVVYNRKKIERYIIKDMLRLKQKCLLEKLTFMDKKDYTCFIGKITGQDIVKPKYDNDGFFTVCGDTSMYAFQNHPGGDCSVKDVLRVYREYKHDKLIIISLSDFSAESINMCASLPGVTLSSGKKVLRMAEEKGLLPDEKEAGEKAEKEMKETLVTFEKIRKNALSGTKIKGYIFSGIVIMCWPLVAGFQVYYPVIAALCFALAAITYKKSRAGQDGNTDVGIS
jgi:hypothetical protein